MLYGVQLENGSINILEMSKFMLVVSGGVLNREIPLDTFDEVLDEIKVQQDSKSSGVDGLYLYKDNQYVCGIRM